MTLSCSDTSRCLLRVWEEDRSSAKNGILLVLGGGAVLRTAHAGVLQSPEVHKLHGIKKKPHDPGEGIMGQGLRRYRLKKAFGLISPFRLPTKKLIYI